MLLRKYMSLLGIGSAQIDLILPKDTYRPGDFIEGYYLIKGGTIEQQIKRVECELMKIHPAEGTEKILDATTNLISRQIDSEETYKLSFYFKLPANIAASTKEIFYRFHTKLVFKEGVESKDQDIIRII